MADYSKQDLEYAAEFREEIHREALEKVHRVRPDIDSVFDPLRVEDYIQEHWDYPGMWYNIIGIPGKFRSRKEFIDSMVKDTLENHRPGEKGQAEPGSANDSVEKKAAEPKRAKKAPDAPKLPDDPFYGILERYPDLFVDYCIVTEVPLPYSGCESHWTALGAACKKLFKENGRTYDVNRARGKRIDVSELFTSHYNNDRLNYRRAFLYPPHGNGYTGKDFVKLNAALFPNGTESLEAYEWSTDWSDYFDEGHEWWGALCLTVYDRSLDRFAVITASATD